jgi:hypothetical protein
MWLFNEKGVVRLKSVKYLMSEIAQLTFVYFYIVPKLGPVIMETYDDRLARINLTSYSQIDAIVPTHNLQEKKFK